MMKNKCCKTCAYAKPATTKRVKCIIFGLYNQKDEFCYKWLDPLEYEIRKYLERLMDDGEALKCAEHIMDIIEDSEVE